MKLSKKSLSNDGRVAFWFLLPSLIGFAAFIVFPVVGSLLLSFVKWDFLTGFKGIEFVGFDNFKQLLSLKDEWFTKSFINTILFAVVTVPIGLSIGLLIAVLINEYVYFSKLFKVAVFIPYISSIVASAVVWMVVFQPSYGPINSFLMAINITDPPKWFVDNKWALPTIMAFQIWQTLGYNIIVFLSGLKAISPDIYEAAKIDGATEFQKFRFVTISMISPTTFFLSTMGIISSFKVFDSISVITSGGPGNSTTVMAFYIYREAFNFYRMGTANAAAWIMFIIIFIVTMLQLKQQNKWVTYD